MGKEHRFLFLSITGAVVFWLAESFLHQHFFDEGAHFEFIPHDANELWMRSFIFVLIIVIGYFAEREITLHKKIAKEKLDMMQAVIHSVDEITGNTFSLMSHYCDEFVKSKQIDEKAVKEMKGIINDTFSS
jgi:hypothetical protein